jgi:sugar lactone lactonase YvrE
MLFRLLGHGLVLTAIVLAANETVSAAEVRSFRMNSRTAFLAGTLDGIGVDALGTLQLADRVERVSEVGEPFLFASSPHPQGWVLGTGNSGKVLLLSRDGELSTLFSAPEPEIFAVWAEESGEVFAGSSPDGKVYRIVDGTASVLFDPQETYIWSLGRSIDGRLLVATGTEGRLYAVDEQGHGEILFDSEDTHLRSLKVLRDGDILVGTAGEGLILRLDPRGVARTLFDAIQPEVVAFAEGPQGVCYAAVLASEASVVDIAKAAARSDEEPESEEQSTAGGAASHQVSISLQGSGAAGVVGSRPEGYKGPRAEVLRISPGGVVESVSSFDQETVYSLIWHRDRLWVGTGLEGQLFSLRDNRLVLEKDVDERQIIGLIADDPGPAFATTNAAAFYRVSGERERQGTYTSPTLDAEQIGRFGNLRWQGGQPKGTGLRFSFRSGLSSEPDRTWTDWSESAQGREISLADVAAGRYLQWRAEFRAADGRSPTISDVTISYRQTNLPPRIKSLSVLDPGQILVPANFNPANQVFEPAHPNREGIFTTLKPAPPQADRRLKPLWKRGFRTLRWETDDPNADSLLYSLTFRREASDGEWLPITDDLEEVYYSFDATVLPDGLYRFRLSASDRQRQEDPEGLRDEEISEPILIDHTPPRLIEVKRGSESWRIEVEDGLNPLREAVFSVGAGEWLPAKPVDGLLDGQRETLLIDAPPAGSLVLLRVSDTAFNLVTFDVSEGRK